jgi:hypothetical protein
MLEPLASANIVPALFHRKTSPSEYNQFRDNRFMTSITDPCIS